MKINFKFGVALSAALLLTPNMTNLVDVTSTTEAGVVYAQTGWENFDYFKDSMIVNSELSEDIWNQIPSSFWDTIQQKLINGEVDFNTAINDIYVNYTDLFALKADGYKTNLYVRYGISQEDIDNLSTSALFALVKESEIMNGGVVDLEYVAASLPSYDAELDNSTDVNLPESLVPSTEEEAIKIATDWWAADMRSVLLKEGVTEEMLAKLPEDAVFKAAVAYKMTYATGGDPGLTLHFFQQMYPEAFVNDTEDLPTVLRPKTEEEAIEIANNGWADDLRTVLMQMGVTEEMLARLPEDAIFKTAVAYKMTYATGGDPGVSYHFFKMMYPEAFSSEVSELTDEERQLKVDKIVENQKKLSEHIEAPNQKVEIEDLKLNESLVFEFGDYDLQSAYILQPGEAGNQAEDKYMLAVRYEYTNTTDEKVELEAVADEFQSHTTVTQFNEDGKSRHGLIKSTYQLPEEAVIEDGETDDELVYVEAGEKTSGGIYFEVTNTQSDLVLSALLDDEVKEFKLDIANLIKLPLASAVYHSESAEPTAYVFDFNKLYLVYSNQADLSEWEGIEHVTSQVDQESLSKEAQGKFELLTSKLALEDTTIVEIDTLVLLVNDDAIEGKVKDNEDTLIELVTSTNWINFQDQSTNTYTIVK